MKQNNITSHQLYTLTAVTTLGGSILVISAAVTGIAKQDAWISALVNIVYGSALIFIFSYLGSRYPGYTLLGIIKKILGKWFGQIICIGYLIFFFVTAQQIPWYVGNFFGSIMYETPPVVLIMLFIVAAAIAILYGIETFARATELFYVFITTVFIISIILILPNMKLENILPVLENGFAPIFKGSVLISGYVSFPVITMIMIYPTNTENLSEGKKALIKGFLWANLLVFISILASILVLGSFVVSKSMFPTVLLARQINVGTIITRVEYIISIIWTVSEFVIEVLYFYVTVKGLSELLGLKDYRKIVIPVGLLLLLFANKAYPDAISQANYITTVWTPFVITFGFILPVFLYLVYLFKKAVLKIV